MMDNTLSNANGTADQGYTSNGAASTSGLALPTGSLPNQSQSVVVGVQPLSEQPAKRRPGRPKGSTKKNLDGIPPPPKIKRPVGRPRKDGHPAGSVGPKKPKTHSTPVAADPSLLAIAQQQAQGTPFAGVCGFSLMRWDKMLTCVLLYARVDNIDLLPRPK